jgi:hypothetical protein
MTDYERGVTDACRVLRNRGLRFNGPIDHHSTELDIRQELLGEYPIPRRDRAKHRS